MGYSVIAPSVVTRPILLATLSVNQSAPSGPVVMPAGPLTGVGTTYSVNVPLVLRRPILLPVFSVNHSARSGPSEILPRPLMGVGTSYSVSIPFMVIRPILLAALSVNHRAPSAPVVMPSGPPDTLWTVAVRVCGDKIASAFSWQCAGGIINAAPQRGPTSLCLNDVIVGL